MMRYRIRHYTLTLGLFLLLLTTTAIMPGCKSTVDVAEESARLLQTDRDSARASREFGAAEAFRRYLAPNAMQMPTGSKPIYGVTNIFQAMLPDDNYLLAWEPQKAEVARSGELGWSWGTSIYTYTDTDSQVQTIHGKYLNVWALQPDGSWKVLVDIGNSSPKPKEIAACVDKRCFSIIQTKGG